MVAKIERSGAVHGERGVGAGHGVTVGGERVNQRPTDLSRGANDKSAHQRAKP